MNTEQEQIFMMSHFLYLQHGADSSKFVVDFDNVWKNVEFTRRDNAKRILVKHFTENIDYKIGALHLGRAIFREQNNAEKAAYQFGEACFEVKNEGENLAPQFGGAAFEGQTAIKNLGGAGQNKETIMLTVDCFKNFCMLAATSKAKEIRTYYIKMENIMHEYYKQFKSKTNELQNSLQLSQQETSIKRHEVLIESNKNKWLVYFCKLQSFDDGSFILKIGETTDIKNRIDALRCDFGTNIILLDAFVCENSIKFEKSLHNSVELTKYKYNKLERKNKKFSTEAYHIPNQKEYEKIVKLATSEMSKYNNVELTKLRIQEKMIDLEKERIYLEKERICFAKTMAHLCKSNDDVMNMLNNMKEPFRNSNNVVFEIQKEKEKEKEDEKIINEPEKENDETTQNDTENTNSPHENTMQLDANSTNIARANSNGPIVQIYHKTDLKTVVKVFDSIMEATRDFNYNNCTPSFTAIKNAFQHKTIYLDHRWHFITDRHEANLQNPRTIGETVITQEKNQGQVAMLNIDKTKIMKVFKIAKDAAREILQHPSAMCVAIKHSSPLGNHYWIRWENVEASLQDAFLKSNALPPKQKNIRGIKINQVNPLTNEVIKIFASYTDVQKEFKISAKKLKEIVETNEIYRGSYRFSKELSV